MYTYIIDYIKLVNRIIEILSINIVDMINIYFEQLWFNKKETDIYLYLVSYWISASSEISKHLNIPKSTINFIADNLWKKWFLKKSFKLNTWYYEADISELENILKNQILEKQNIILKLIPNLKEKNKNIKSKPKIIFIDWIENCKKAYLDILKTKKVFYEFWAHKDLEDAFSKEFMEYFIEKRIENNLFCEAIWHFWEIEKNLKLRDEEELRNLKIFWSEFWEIYSSISIYENKVLILNLNWVYSWVLIENKELSQTIKTIFKICVR